MEEKTNIWKYVIFFIFFFFCCLSLTVNISSLQKNFLFADEAIYLAMTQSIAHDYDIEYTRRDLNRYYQHFDAGPLGIFLKKGENNKIYYAKSLVYPLLASPYVRWLGANGFLVFHALLLLLLLLMGFFYLGFDLSPSLSLAWILSFVFGSVAWIYFVWISPDFFNLVLVFTCLFLILYKHRHKEVNSNHPLVVSTNRLHRFLVSDTSDYLAAVFIGLAVYSKPPNIVLLAPLLLPSLLKRRLVKPVLLFLLFMAISLICWGGNYLLTGDWNYQGGERKTFYFQYPLEKDSFTFDSLGAKMSAEGYGERHLFPPRIVLSNLFYYFFGRFTGLTWYFFPAFFWLVLFLGRKKRWYQWIILLSLGSEILIYIFLMPDNYAGGGGALANRYFLNIYPLFFFLSPRSLKSRDLISIWLMASLFLSPILISPWKSSQFPATHAKKRPFKWLPVELTLINNLPTNTNPDAFRQEIGTPPHIGWLHFLDDNFHPRLEPDGFWTKGPHQAEMILKTYYPVEKLVIHLLNNPRKRNRITVQVGQTKKSVVLGYKQWGTLEFEPVKAFRMRAIHLYRLKIKAEKGSIPYFEDHSSDERRFLGVFFKIEIIPAEKDIN